MFYASGHVPVENIYRRIEQFSSQPGWAAVVLQSSSEFMGLESLTACFDDHFCCPIITHAE